jgi:hypothetical protein
MSDPSDPLSVFQGPAMAEGDLDAPPQLSLKLDEDSDGPVKLADRWTRLTASIIDSIIELVFAGPAMLTLGLRSYFYQGAQLAKPRAATSRHGALRARPFRSRDQSVTFVGHN